MVYVFSNELLLVPLFCISRVTLANLEDLVREVLLALRYADST